MSAHYRLDGFLLERFHADGAYQAGVYALAYRLLDAANMVGYLAASFLVPFITRNIKDVEITNSAVNNVRHFLILISVLALTFMMFFAPWVQQVLYYSNNEYYSQILQLCIASLPAYFLVQVYGSVLTAANELKIFIWILLTSVLINTTLNLFLIPTLGAQACCISALISQYICGVTTCIAALKKTKLLFDISSVASYISCALLLIILFYYGRNNLNEVFLLAVGSFVVLFFIFIKTQRLRNYLLISKKVHA
jgi:O-antigen/teichoic acid export membrane protein